MNRLVNTELFKRIIEPQNIYAAIYSLNSYVFEKGLLSPEDYVKYTHLKDKHDDKFIDSVIDECIEKIKHIFINDEILEIKVFFKPKKIKDKEVEFRPIHTADLVTQICIVAMLNQIMFDDSDGTRKLSDLSKLLPSNFYGNIPSTNVETLFEPWNKKYQEYSENIIEANRKFYNTKEYKNEINLDLERFFPSINPAYIHSCVLKKLPVTYNAQEKICFDHLLQKLLFFRVNIREDEAFYYYPEHCRKDIINRRFFYNVGIPQGLPQAYYFGNICMVEISKLIENKFGGTAFYYVDDSVIYTNYDRDFNIAIAELNDEINKTLYNQDSFYRGQFAYSPHSNLMNYEIKIHKEGKSTLSPISSGEYLFLFAKPASAISFEIKASLDDIEDITLYKKTQTLIDEIDKKIIEINNANNRVINTNSENLKLLKRYKKFYTYRLKILKLREDNEITETDISDFYKKYGLNKGDDRNTFIDRLEDDIFLIEASLLIKHLKANTTKQNEILDKIKFFENKINKNKIKNNYFSTTLETSLNFQLYSKDKYQTLESEVKFAIPPFFKVSQEKGLKCIKSILRCFTDNFSQENQLDNSILKFLTKYSKNKYKFIFANSSEFKRQLINSLISFVLNVNLNDSFNIVKADSRTILYYELRIMMFLRNNYFKISTFLEFANSLISEQEKTNNSEKIDLSLYEVLSIYRLYVKDSSRIDNLILTHRYVNGIWKNGSKFLHFYTLHNEEHSVELIKNCVRITKAIDYLTIKGSDYYILFLACYLHDISMVMYPDLSSFSQDSINSDLIYTKWKVDIKNIVEDIESASVKDVKTFMVKYFEELNNYFENDIRSNHHTRSAGIIKSQNELFFIDVLLRQLVAEVSEAHGYDVNDVYGLRSSSRKDVISKKYLMIILRFADLLDMSKDRVSINVLNNNFANMSDESRYHWISHLALDKCTINTNFESVNSNDSPIDLKKIKEIVQINLNLNVRQITSTTGLECVGYRCVFDNGNKNKLTIIFDKNTICDIQCNFLCKWMVKKHHFLFIEIAEFQKYLERLSNNNIFKTEFQIIIEYDNRNLLPSKYLDTIGKKIDMIDF